VLVGGGFDGGFGLYPLFGAHRFGHAPECQTV
jgi:hypothetical protein